MLGQNFAQAAGIEFLDRDNLRKNPYGTSWGFSTRMVGATIMAHGDDAGLVLPPNVAPTQLVIVPIFRTEDDRVAVAGAIERLETSLADVQTVSGPLRYKVDWREETPGFKYNHWELRGVPLRLEIGPRDVAAGQGVLVRRVDRAKEAIALDASPAELPRRLAGLPGGGLPAGARFPRPRTRTWSTRYDEFQAVLDGRGRLPDGALVRLGRVREAGQRRDRRDHPRASPSTRPTSRAHASSTASPRSAGSCSRAPTRRVERRVGGHRPASTPELTAGRTTGAACYLTRDADHVAPRRPIPGVSSTGRPRLLSIPTRPMHGCGRSGRSCPSGGRIRAVVLASRPNCTQAVGALGCR